MRQLVLTLAATGVFATVALAVGPVQTTTPTAPIPGGQGPSRGASPTIGTGLLMGQVLDGSTGRPVPDAIVSCSGGGLRGAANAAQPSQPRVMVDGQGRFVFRDLPAGTFTLGAAKAGYFGGASGQRTPMGPSRPIELGDGERIGDVTLRLWPYATVTGTVLDEAGAPVAGISAQLFRRSAVNGRWQFTGSASAETDDRGAYRFGSVTPGSYVVAVRSGDVAGEQLMMSLLMSDESNFMKLLPKLVNRGEESQIIDGSVRLIPTTYYPNMTTSSQAMEIAITPGVERSGVDFRVKAVPARSVAGTVTGLPASTSVNVRLKSIDAAVADALIASASVSADPNGTNSNSRFIMTGVPAGQYILEAESRAQVSGSRAMRAGARGGGAPGAPLPPAPDAPTMCASMPVTIGDRNITDLVVALHAGGRVSGRVEFDGGAERPTPEQLNQISVTIAPVDQAQNNFQNILNGRVEADGTFRTASVAPGRYVVRVGAVMGARAGGPGAGPGWGGGGGGGIAAVGGLRGAGSVASPWRPRSAMVGGVDVLDQPIEMDASDIDSVVITFTDQPLPSLSGTVRDATGTVDPEAVIIVFPADNRLWSDLGQTARRVKTSRTTRAGAYLIPGLPAGDYFVAVGRDELLADWQAPNALDTLSRQATRVQLIDGQNQTVDLKGGGR
jgi:hypothetical protein